MTILNTNAAFHLERCQKDIRKELGLVLEYAAKGGLAEKKTELKHLANEIIEYISSPDEGFIRSAGQVLQPRISEMNTKLKLWLDTMQSIPDIKMNAVTVVNGLNRLESLVDEINHIFRRAERLESILSIETSIEQSFSRLETVNLSITDLETKYPRLENEVNASLERAASAQSAFEVKIKEMMGDANHLLSIFSAEKIGLNYKNRSDKEIKTADNFRTASLVLMGFILAADIAYCFQGIFHGFTTEATSTVVALSFLMYIPAIYLTKESNKHRKIQNANLQLSNDIESVLTFISSLPETEQLRLKSSLALILIAGRNNHEKSEEEGTLLTQEIVKQVLGSIKPEKGN